MIVEKRNARPYVLGLCFLWGLVLGFIVYSTSQSTAEITDREQKEEQAKERERQRELAAARAKNRNKNVVKIDGVSQDIKPPIAVAELPAPPTVEEDEVKNAAKSKDWRSVPQIAKVPMNPAYGLTARTSPPPLPVEKLDIRETQRRNARAAAAMGIRETPPPAATPSRPIGPATAPVVRKDDLPLPEID